MSRRPRRGTQQVTIRDVARVAGVAPITVSRALQAPDKVAPSTLARVQDTVRELGYVPNLAAGTLASNKSHLVAIIVPNIANAIFAETIQTLADTLRPKGYHLLIGHSRYEPEEEEDLVRAFLARRLDGIVLTGHTHSSGTVELLRQAAIPVVEMWTIAPEPIRVCVGFSNFDASYRMTAHIASKGYQRIGYIGGPVENNDRTAQREAGYRKALLDCGLEFSTQQIQRSMFGFEQGVQAMNTLLQRCAHLDAVFAASDTLAVGALLECQRRGFNIPQQLGLAGFDDADIAARTSPPLTTVRVPRQAIGQKVAEQLLAGFANDLPPGQVFDLGFEIIERASL